jgi:hypothetical protein
MDDVETLREQFVARGEEFVSDLIGQEVNFSDSSGSEELIGNYQQSVQDGIDAAIASFTSGATAPSTEAAPAVPAAEQSATTQENLTATGVEQVFANLGNDSLTNPSEGSSTSNYQFNFEPAAEGDGGLVSLSLDGQSTPLFSFSASGTSSSTTGDNPFAAQFEEFIAGLASGENSLAGA